MVEQRNSLIELLKHLDGNFKRTCPAYNNPNIGFEKLGNCTGCKYQIGKDDCDYIARATDYLLDNGVILPPCKIGDKVYYICEEFEEYGGNYVSELTITEISNVRFWVENEDENHFRFTDIGKTVFLTREEAEVALEKPRAEANNDR